MKITGFKHLCNISLHYKGDCALLGGDLATLDCFVEEYYEDEVLYHHLADDGRIIASGEINIPEVLNAPHSPASHLLNHSGGRYRGLREDDRVAEWVQSLTVMEKMPLIRHLNVPLSPMTLLGIAESRVLSEVRLTDKVTFVCRRVRLAYALPQPQVDDHDLPYDYDTLVLHIAHIYDVENDTAPSLTTAVQGIDGVILQRPLDCIVQEGKLIIADASDGVNVSRMVVYKVLSS
jgi:hypothetical protein